MGNLIVAEEEAACAKKSPVTASRHLLAPLVLAITILSGCSLTGGGVPPGEPNIPSLPTDLGTGRVVTGRVQSALPPYSPIPSATVTIQAPTGATVAPTTPVNGDGTFSFSHVPFGSLTLQVAVNNPNVQDLSLPIQPMSQLLVQFVASAVPPTSAVPPATAVQSLTLDTDNAQPLLHQRSHVTAKLGGTSTLGLAPSWAAYGVAGYLSAAGPVASFDAQAPGPESIYAISGTVTGTVQLTVPSSLAYLNPPAAQTSGTTAGSATAGAGNGTNQTVSNRSASVAAPK